MSEDSQLIIRLEDVRNDPALFVRRVIGAEVEPWQEKALLAVRDHDRVAIRSGHGVGKSALLAWLVIWWLSTRYPAKVACTAPTAHQLQDVLWGEIAKWRRSMTIGYFRDQLEIKSDRVELKGATAESFAVARTARKEQPEAFQGFHSENMLFLADEASGIEEIIFEVGEGAMSTPGAKTILAGNPTRTSGYFFDAFHRMRAHWHCLRVSCRDSARVSQEYPKQMAERYGEESNIYKVRVLGDFPSAEDDAVIPLHLCEAARYRDVAPLLVEAVWGVDVARFGDDRSALAKRRGNALVEPVKVWSQLDTMQVAGRVMLEYENSVEKPRMILVDVIGLGAGVVDRLKELGAPVRGINVAESAAASERFLRLRDELWFKVREWLEAKDCLLPDDALIAELALPKYCVTSAGKIQVENKDDLKKRGARSPDLADAFCLTFAAGMDRTGRVKAAGRARLHLPGPLGWMGA